MAEINIKIVKQIKIVKLLNGDDIVTAFPIEQLEDKSPYIRLVKPLQIKYVPQFTKAGLKDYIALIKWNGFTHDPIVTIPKDKILTITNATEEMSRSYHQIAKGYEKIDPPPQGKENDEHYEQERLSEEAEEEYNEIWDSFRDTKKTLH
jgi:hypothetical protein